MLDILYRLALPFAAIGLLGFIYYTFRRQRYIFVIATISSLITFIIISIVLLSVTVQYGPGSAFVNGARYLTFAWVIMLIYFLAEFRYRVRLLGSILMPIALMLMIISLFDNQGSENARITISDYTTITHVTLVLIGFGLLFLAFASAILYFLKRNALKKHLESAVDDQLPALSILRRIMETAFYAGFPAFTIGIILGIVYAGSVLSSGWIWDSKILIGLINWFFYSILFFLRQSEKISPKTFASCIILLFIFIISSFLFTTHNITFSSSGHDRHQKQIQSDLK